METELSTKLPELNALLRAGVRILENLGQPSLDIELDSEDEETAVASAKALFRRLFRIAKTQGSDAFPRIFGLGKDLYGSKKSMEDAAKMVEAAKSRQADKLKDLVNPKLAKRVEEIEDKDLPLLGTAIRLAAFQHTLNL